MIDRRSLLLLAIALCISAPASALDGETADLVSTYTIDMPRFFGVDEDDGTVFVGATDCESMLTDSRISVVFATLFDPTGAERDVFEEVDIFSVARDSPTGIVCPGEFCQTLMSPDDYALTSSGVTVDIPFADLLAVGSYTECTGFDAEFFVRLIVEDSLDGATSTENADAKIVVDTIKPSSPSGVTASATENTIRVSFDASADSDVSRYFVYWSAAPFDGGQDPETLTLERKPIGEDTSADLSVSLDPAADLYVAVAAEDFAGNLSDLSGVAQADVTETNDFWEQYRQAGGSEEGGCATTSGNGSSWLVLILLGLLGLRRRRKSFGLATAALAILLLLPMSAAAETPTWGAFEIKFGGYYPAIDEEFGGSGPFGDVFGAKNLLLGELEVDGWIWQRFGKLGIAGHIGYSRVKGGAVTSDETATAEGDAAIEDTTAFTVFPMRISAVYRFDWLAQNTRVPISLSLKIGPDFYRWRISNSNKETATFDGDAGSGWKKGWHVAAGLQLLLDFIDKSTAAAFDLSWGINNSYLFVEYMATKIDDFGGTGFDLSDNIWMFGLSFEF